MGPSRLSTPTFFPSSQWALVHSWTLASGTIQYEMEGNIDLGPQLWVVICPGVAVFRRPELADAVWSRRASASSHSNAQTNKQIGGLCLLPAVSTLFLPAVLRRHIPPYSQRTEGGEASGLLACNTIPPHQTSYQGRFLTSASHHHSSSLLPRLFHFPRSTSGNYNWGKLQRPGYCSH